MIFSNVFRKFSIRSRLFACSPLMRVRKGALVCIY